MAYAHPSRGPFSADASASSGGSQSSHAVHDTRHLQGHAAARGTVAKERSCTTCSKRKVKCDKKYPCSACTRLELECVYATSGRPQRRARSVQKDGLQGQLEKLQSAVKSLEAEIAAQNRGEAGPTRGSMRSSQDSEMEALAEDSTGQARPLNGVNSMVEDWERERPVNTRTWKNLETEIRNVGQQLDESVANGQEDTSRYGSPSWHPPTRHGFPFGRTSTCDSLYSIHPHAGHIFLLWHTFQENVDPIVKLFHAPTVQRAMMEASTDLHNIASATEALMFGVYYLAVVTMTAVDCKTRLGQEKATLLAKYRFGAEEALMQARFIDTTDIVVLQAFTLYLLAVRKTHDPNFAWTLTGLALRIGRRMRMHRDDDTNQRPPFEAEMHRRLWWAMLMLDARTSESLDCDRVVVEELLDVGLPLNVNDSELDPTMSKAPMEHEGTTEMTFVLVRYEVLAAVKGLRLGDHKISRGFVRLWDYVGSPAVPQEDKRRLLDSMERNLEGKFLKYCNPTVPLYLLASSMARIVLCTMRLSAAGGLRQPRETSDLPQSTKDSLFDNSLEIVETSILASSNEGTKKWAWHTQNHFQWHAFTYLLSDLCDRTTGPEVGRAWRAVQSVFEDILPKMSFLESNKTVIMKPIAQLASKAWAAREKELQRQRQQPQPESSLQQRVSAAGQISTPPDLVGRLADDDIMMEADSWIGSQPQQQPLGLQGGLDTLFCENSLFDVAALGDSPMDWTEWYQTVANFDAMQYLNDDALFQNKQGDWWEIG